jgi:hypothetical protein
MVADSRKDMFSPVIGRQRYINMTTRTCDTRKTHSAACVLYAEAVALGSCTPCDLQVTDCLHPRYVTVKIKRLRKT